MKTPSRFHGLLAAALLLAASEVWGAEFLAGADLSHVAWFESRGKTYRADGSAKDPLAIAKAAGINCVRLRLFTSSAEQARTSPYNSINNLAYTIPLAQRVRRAGLAWVLDFHYSDSWADPGHQNKPAAWANLSFDQLEQRLREYNRECLTAFRKADALPEFVQVGNEITPGMIWPEGRVGGTNDTPRQWAQLGRLINAAIAGMREAAGPRMPRIIIHLDRGGDWKTTQWFFDHLREQQVDYDLIGQSYYPFWHGTLADLSRCLTNAAARYGKPVVVMETAFPWSTRETRPIVGIAPGKEGQVEFVAALAKVLQGVPDGKGAGIFWWGSEYLSLPGANLAGFDGRSFFDRDGNALPVIRALGRLAGQAEKPK